MNDKMNKNKYRGTPITHHGKYKMPKPKNCDQGFETPRSNASDSDESTASSGSIEPPNTELSLVAEFDDLIRMYEQLPNETVENAFYTLAEQSLDIVKQWRTASGEACRLQMEIDKKNHELRDLENKLAVARKLLDQEKRNTRRAEDERNVFEEQVTKMRDVLCKDFKNKITEETKEKLRFLNLRYSNCDKNMNLSAIPEVNSTGSLLSDFSYSISEDDLDTTSVKYAKAWKKHSSNGDMPEEPATKKRRSSGNKIVEISNKDTVRATTTLTISNRGPITATSVIESVPNEGKENAVVTTPKPSIPSANVIYDLWQNSPKYADTANNKLGQHSFHPKTIVMPDICLACEKRIRFGKTGMKCRNCRGLCHPECKDNLPLPCIPTVNTPTHRNATGLIGDFTPTNPPMVPALVVHCLKEIEAKGLTEIGIYRIPGSEKDVKTLKEKFLRGKGAPSLNQIDVHVICGTVKDFLRSLSEPLVTYSLWPEFVRAVHGKEHQDIAPSLCQIISELPQPNRDTLAYMILHFKRIAEAKDCKMPASNLSKVFGPTIVGYSSNDPSQHNLLTETSQQVAVMEHLINLPTEYWMSFVTGQQQFGKLQRTPSTDSVLRPTLTGGLLSPTIRLPTKRTRAKRFLPLPASLLD